MASANSSLISHFGLGKQLGKQSGVSEINNCSRMKTTRYWAWTPWGWDGFCTGLSLERQMSTDLEIRNVVVVQGRGELAGQGRRWEHLTWGVLSWWDRVDKQHSSVGLLQLRVGVGAWSKTDTELGSHQRRFSNHGWPLSSSSSSLSGFCYSHQELSPVLSSAL